MIKLTDEDYKNMREFIKSLDYEKLGECLDNAKSEKERYFYNDLQNLVLQTRQKDTIEKGIF